MSTRTRPLITSAGANHNNPSLTVPLAIATHMGLKKGDRVLWVTGPNNSAMIVNAEYVLGIEAKKGEHHEQATVTG